MYIALAHRVNIPDNIAYSEGLLIQGMAYGCTYRIGRYYADCSRTISTYHILMLATEARWKELFSAVASIFNVRWLWVVVIDVYGQLYIDGQRVVQCWGGVYYPNPTKQYRRWGSFQKCIRRVSGIHLCTYISHKSDHIVIEVCVIICFTTKVMMQHV